MSYSGEIMNEIASVTQIIRDFNLKAMGSASLPPRESLAASDAMGAARQQLQATELWFVCYDNTVSAKKKCMLNFYSVMRHWPDLLRTLRRR